MKPERLERRLWQASNTRRPIVASVLQLNRSLARRGWNTSTRHNAHNGGIPQFEHMRCVHLQGYGHSCLRPTVDLLLMSIWVPKALQAISNDSNLVSTPISQSCIYSVVVDRNWFARHPWSVRISLHDAYCRSCRK